MEQESDHRAEILSGTAPKDQRLGRGRNCGEGQVLRLGAERASECGDGGPTQERGSVHLGFGGNGRGGRGRLGGRAGLGTGRAGTVLPRTQPSSSDVNGGSSSPPPSRRVGHAEAGSSSPQPSSARGEPEPETQESEASVDNIKAPSQKSAFAGRGHGWLLALRPPGTVAVGPPPPRYRRFCGSIDGTPSRAVSGRLGRLLRRVGRTYHRRSSIRARTRDRSGAAGGCEPFAVTQRRREIGIALGRTRAICS